MNTFTNLLSSLILAMLTIAIAIFSIQNVDDVSLKFLNFESITLPVGVMLIFCGAMGILLGWFLPLLFTRKRPRRG
ncbi:MAG: LapA family protein [Cyanobacteria bacterium P01_A01_bin.83]